MVRTEALTEALTESLMASSESLMLTDRLLALMGNYEQRKKMDKMQGSE